MAAYSRDPQPIRGWGCQAKASWKEALSFIRLFSGDFKRISILRVDSVCRPGAWRGAQSGCWWPRPEMWIGEEDTLIADGEKLGSWGLISRVAQHNMVATSHAQLSQLIKIKLSSSAGLHLATF